MLALQSALALTAASHPCPQVLVASLVPHRRRLCKFARALHDGCEIDGVQAAARAYRIGNNVELWCMVFSQDRRFLPEGRGEQSVIIPCAQTRF
jgi:hypothetical protein